MIDEFMFLLKDFNYVDWEVKIYFNVKENKVEGYKEFVVFKEGFRSI